VTPILLSAPNLEVAAAGCPWSNHMLLRKKRLSAAGATPGRRVPALPPVREMPLSGEVALDRLIECGGDQNAAKDPDEVFREEGLLQKRGDARAGIVELRRHGLLGVPAHHDDRQIGPALP